MERKLTKKQAVELFFGVLLVLSIIAVGIAAWMGATTPEPDEWNGFRTDEGGTRYYDAGVYRTGFVESEGKQYYFSYNNDGYMVTGAMRIGGKLYFFGENGARILTGFVTDNEDTYYLTDGVPVTGWQTIGDNRYYFFVDTGIMARGTATVGGVSYTFSDDGILMK